MGAIKVVSGCNKGCCRVNKGCCRVKKGCCRDLFEMVVRKKKIKVKNQSRKIVSLKL